MPKISKVDQEQIRSVAKRYSMGLWASPFNEGLLIYSETFDALYIRSARWKYCLKCGEIEPTEEMVDKTELDKSDLSKSEREDLEKRVHECSLGINRFPVLITTSWYKLKDFFLTTRHIKALEKAGIADKKVQIPEIKQIIALAELEELPEYIEHEA